MYAKDTGELIRVRLIKLYEFPMGTLCCHGLTFSDGGRLSPSHYFRPPKMFTALRLWHLILFQVEDQNSVQLLSRLSSKLRLEYLSLEFEDLNRPTSNGR
jgi:hypothetical protein